MKPRHTFVICAYKESEYLEACIRSLLRQTIPSRVVIATSTPNAYIQKTAEKYHLEVFINQGESGIAGDWNFAYSCSDSEFTTIAHQDDIYKKQYAETMIAALTGADHPLIAFCDYSEIRGKKEVRKSRNLQIKRVLLTPLKVRRLAGRRWAKRFVLRFGNAICCPSVTYASGNLSGKMFEQHFRSNVDWQTWERLSNTRGEFIYVPQILMSHRIHEGSETSATIQDHERGKEDFEMFCKFWPTWIARKLTGAYSASEESNSLKKEEKL